MILLWFVDDTSTEDDTPKLWSIAAEELPKSYKLYGRSWGFRGKKLVQKDKMKLHRISLNKEEAISLWRAHVQHQHELHDSLARRALKHLEQEPVP